MAGAQRTATTGAPFDISITGGYPPLRREINDLIKDKIPFSIFIQALARMQKESEQDDLSYFQLCGIHGLPYTAWQGAGGASGTARTGYCTHSSQLFPTWHRPYIALFEQILCKHARDVASESGVKAWVDAADVLRLPYWDWAIKKMPPPEVSSLASIDIVKPDGSTMTIDDNPLFSYSFRDRTSQQTLGGRETNRGDWSWFDEGGNLTAEMRGKVILMFNTIHDWYNFSNDARMEGAADFAAHANSLEAIHDQIHGDVGGFMGVVARAAFDPIFWLHHCNIDRLYALWQVLNPGVGVEARNNKGAVTWTIGRNSVVSADTPLTPFWSPSTTSSQDFWTSADVELTPTFGYSYPELAALTTNDPQAEMLTVVTNLYGSEQDKARAIKIAALRSAQNVSPALEAAVTTAAEAVKPIATPTVDEATESREASDPPSEEAVPALPSLVPALPPTQWWGVPAQQVFGVQAGSAGAAAEAAPEEPRGEAKEATKDSKEGPAEQKVANEPAKSHDTGLTDWFARICVEKYALNASFRVCIFLVPDGTDNATISEVDPSTWPKSEYYVGQMCSFVNSTNMSSCDNCIQQSENKLVVEGYVPLDEHLVKYSGLTSYGHEEVHAYLHRNLIWRCQKVDGPAVPMSEMPSLEVGVWSTTLVYNFTDEKTVLPKWSDPHCHVGVTAGQPGGCQHTSGPYTPMIET